MMRITTQMINEGARKAGLPIHGNSLLDYIKTDTGNSLLNSLNGTTYGTNISNSVSSVRKNNYEKLEKNAEKIMDIVESFSAEGEDTIFKKAKETGDNQEICKTTKSLVDAYNSTMKLLKESDSVLDGYYKEMFDEVVSESKIALEDIGITVSHKGTLSLDETKMMDTDVDTLEKTLGAASVFSEKIGFLASRVASNADSNAASLSNHYGSSGDIQSLLNSKFDWWG